ncbi:hypothetical protein JB92DRAFT_3108112 [Gautieria morchelliformis]|nr:hypothetical protein JB92DRAFT_3108112 [Gautieria morchelliformis]
MPVTRFVAVKVKDEYAADDEKSKQTREEFFQKHLALYRSRPYVTKVQGRLGGNQPLGQGYTYGIVVEFESEEKVAYYNDVDPEHLDFKAGYFNFHQQSEF